jgi:hypothetical protein
MPVIVFGKSQGAVSFHISKYPQSDAHDFNQQDGVPQVVRDHIKAPACMLAADAEPVLRINDWFVVMKPASTFG